MKQVLQPQQYFAYWLGDRTSAVKRHWQMLHGRKYARPAPGIHHPHMSNTGLRQAEKISQLYQGDSPVILD